MHGIDANQDITDDVLTWDNIMAFVKTAAEAPPGIFAEAFGPIGDGPVSAHSTQASVVSQGNIVISTGERCLYT